MSINHLPPEPPPAWTWRIPTDEHAGKLFPQQRPQYHHQQQEQQLLASNNERELLFEKPLTPSDVGKLNRLVIPKQHAERHFPLDGDCGEKGLLLSFLDESGRAWQFRYSYWTSSQSYVLTKGWSRFVKEKKLDPGDVVLFERRRSGGGGDRLYIGWKRRGEHAGVQKDGAPYTANACTAQWNPTQHGAAAPSPPGPLSNTAEPYLHSTVAARRVPLHDAGEQAGGPAEKAGSARPCAGTSSRRLRLFGVNLDCGPEQEQPESHRPSRSSSSSSSCMEGYGRGHWSQFMRSGGPGSPQ